MADYFAIKRLTACDCTLFEAVFPTIDAGDRQSIDLDADVLVGRFYPNLSMEAVAETCNEILLGLTIYGPDAKPADCVTRAIKRGSSNKDWRLTGGLVRRPLDDPTRYDKIRPGDLAVMAFTGTGRPYRIDLILLSYSAVDDLAAIEALSPFCNERSMVAVTQAQIGATLRNATVSELHPVRMAAADTERDAATEDAVWSGAVGSAWLARHRSNWPMTVPELLKVKREAEETHWEGVGVANLWVATQVSNGRLKRYEWISEENTLTPCDFEAYCANGNRHRFQAKSTRGPFERTIHLSLAQIVMAAAGIPYRIIRVFELEDFNGKIRVSEDIGPLARTLVALEDVHTPSGVRADAFSVATDSLVWGDEVSIEWPDE